MVKQLIITINYRHDTKMWLYIPYDRTGKKTMANTTILWSTKEERPTINHRQFARKS